MSLDSASAMAPNAAGTLHLTFALKSTAQQNAARFVNSLSDPKSPNYHHWLTPDQYGQRFGATTSDIDAVVQYLNQNGFSKVKVWPNKLFISAETPTSAAEALFKVKIGSYRRSAAEIARGFSPDFYAPDAEPKIGTAIASRLSGIFGLSNAAQHRPLLKRAPAVADANPAGGLNPSDLAELYSGAALHTAGYEGAGVTVAIFSPTAYSTSDVNSFLSYNKLNGTDITIVNVNGGNSDLSNSEEACLDIEAVVGQAPAAAIKVYEGPNDGSLDIFNQMASDDPGIVTESYGADENSVTAAYADSYESLREQMAAEGISIIVAGGDNGAYDSNNQSTVTVSVDASSAYVTAIGGTELSPFINDTWNGEIAWTYNDGTLGTNSGSGGGLSIYYSQPSWQTGPGVSNADSNGMRQIPDVSTLASTPFYSIYSGGQFGEYGGTSCACQFFGGSLALIEEQLGEKLGNIDPDLYNYGMNNASVYHDIISGNNGVYYCTPNWDFVTGWGSPDFAKLALAFQNLTVNPSGVHSFGSGLQMFSVPFSFDAGTTPAEELSGLVTPAGAPAYVVAAYLPLTSEYAISPTAPANTLSPGIGYWARFNASSGGKLAVSGTAVTSPTFVDTLSPGWNMVGDPYMNSVTIDSLQIAASGSTTSFANAAGSGIVLPEFYDYNGSIYVPHGSGDVLNPFDGYWIDAAQSCQLIFTSP